MRLGLRYLSTWTGTLLSLASGLVFTTLLVAALQFRDLAAVSLTAVVSFGVIGVLNFPLGRFFNYLAMDRLGVARSTPILASAPLFAVIIAVIFTGEEVRLGTASGLVLILGGLYVTVTAHHDQPGRPAATSEDQRAGTAQLRGVLFALGAALAYGTAQVLTRHGVQDLAPPLIGTLIALFWGTLGFAMLSARSLSLGVNDLRRGAAFFVAGGICSATGVILLFHALTQGRVVVVSPIAATNPLFTLLFASLLLRGVERITRRVVMGALLVVAGVIVLSVF